jgi:hypothetical protein
MAALGGLTVTGANFARIATPSNIRMSTFASQVTEIDTVAMGLESSMRATDLFGGGAPTVLLFFLLTNA